MEQWKTVSGYEDYSVSNTGLVRSDRFNRILKPSESNNGYTYINLVKNRIKKTHSIHKLVMEYFGDEKPSANFVIDHFDGNKTNNHISNLQWVSIQENTTRAYNNYDKKLRIIELHKQGMKAKDIQAKVGMALCTVYQTILLHEQAA